MERDYDELLQKESREKIKAARAESEIVNLKNQIDSLEVQKATSRASSEAKNSMEASKFDVEIARLTKEGDLARTELEVCKHDLDKLEVDLKRQNDENKRLKSEQNS